MHLPFYGASKALVIGINHYSSASPLAFARADAEAVADILVARFSFANVDVTSLLDEAATRSAILEAFFRLTTTAADDRVVVFFAGHGHTVSSRRGEVGFLVPADGDAANLASLIRWDELTRGADLIPAKHVLFLMDACYGGLAITRRLKPGAMRFLHDMARRPARQVLTAGKADEVVADEGGPIGGHSPFTGYLLEGLNGSAANVNGILTANSLMAYVYQSVSQDDRCKQTPHYGYVEGDGDLVFAPSLEPPTAEDEKKGEDTLISVPASYQAVEESFNFVGLTKEYLADSRHTLKLHDLLSIELRRVLGLISADQFDISRTWSDAEFSTRLAEYDHALRDLVPAQTLLGYWGSGVHRSCLVLPIKRLTDKLVAQGGNSGWLALRWYPSLVLLYAGGLSAVAAKRYDNLHSILSAVVNPQLENDDGSAEFVTALHRGISDVVDSFKLLPGNERKYAPLSEYLHHVLQPVVDDSIFVGSEFDVAFDEFEVLYAISYMHRCLASGTNYCFPPVGRFGWKGRWRGEPGPLTQVITQAERSGEEWPPLAAGMFDRSLEKFQLAAAKTREGVNKLQWY
jgi:hypothetical protein